MIWPKLPAASSGTSWCRQPSRFWHSPLQHQPREYRGKTWDHQMCKSNCTDVRFLKLIFSGLLAFYKHIFKSVSFLLASITAWTLSKSLVKISVYQTSVTNLGFQPGRERLNANKYSGVPTGHLTDLQTVLAAKLCPLNKSQSKVESFHSCTPQIFSHSPKSSFCIQFLFGKLQGQTRQASAASGRPARAAAALFFFCPDKLPSEFWAELSPSVSFVRVSTAQT